VFLTLLPACETDNNPPGGSLPDAAADGSVEPDAVEVPDVPPDVPPDWPRVDAGVDVDGGFDVPPEPADVPLDLPPEPSDVPLDLPPEPADVPADVPVDVPAESVDAIDAGGDVAVQCTGDSPMFPAFDKACTEPGECAIGLHQVDCCGNRVAVGLAATAKAAFDAAEAVCEEQYPKCGCPQGPVVAEDGSQAFDPADVAVTCVFGACQTQVPPCALVKPFEWANSCATDSDCALALHQVNCCGTYHAWGIAATGAQAFAEAEAACEASYPACGCASQPTLAQDGNTASSLDDLAVTCQEGACRSHVPGTTPKCHDANDCPGGQMCLSPGEPMPCGMCYPAEDTCAGDPDCPEGAVCELVSGGCQCWAATQCVPACNLPASTACPEGQSCDSVGHCGPTPCADDADCPALFSCQAGPAPTCARTACVSDDQCGWGRCVQGLCHTQLGSCIYPPP